jgi:hypothetical protein
MLSAKTDLPLPGTGAIYSLSTGEAEDLAEQVRKRNVFARHSWENSFYFQRVKALGDHTVIEIRLHGDPQDIRDRVGQLAATVEQIAVLSSALALGKAKLQRKLGISAKPKTETDFIISPEFRYLSSREKAAPTAEEIAVDGQFCRRFERCGFGTLVRCAMSESAVAIRIRLSLDWLFDSRMEPRLPASVVKTSTALECLLIWSESESLAQSLSERAAFILSSDPATRQVISRILKRFYEVRSGIVHGSQKKSKNLTPQLLEVVDRLATLLCLVVGANAELWPSVEELRQWCEDQRWGSPSKIKLPFPDQYLRNTIKIANRELEPKQQGRRASSKSPWQAEMQPMPSSQA